jgi:hypothetical protein
LPGKNLLLAKVECKEAKREGPSEKGVEREGDRREHWWNRQHRGGSRIWECKEQGNQDPSDDSLMSTDRMKRRIEEKEKQACTIFVGDLNPETSAKQLTGLCKRFENQRELLLQV